MLKSYGTFLFNFYLISFFLVEWLMKRLFCSVFIRSKNVINLVA